ncbi:aminotransferase class I/II-fold pyridoxal phosphate-dependent enzyme [Alphaproteobacteria bacterium]|nr:aminotransferase class I/II-fold pyridoxal phosphate-dependent enzyme [Alphaproteobacteria bacterium]
MTYRYDQIFDYPYHKLPLVLGESPYEGDRISMHIGEPTVPPPSFVQDAINQNSHLWTKYPHALGTIEYRETVATWMGQRYPGLAGKVDPVTELSASAGSKEALFLSAITAVMRKEKMLKGKQPVVMTPSPAYHVYYGAGLSAGAETIPYGLYKENNFAPDWDSFPKEQLERLAIFYLCTPNNPIGSILSKADLQKAIKVAREYDFILGVDECYSELFYDEAPTGSLEAAEELGDHFKNVICYNSLSKRSGAAGLRVGFVAGDAEFMKGFAIMRGYGAPQVPTPLQAAAIVLWKDEDHVEKGRAFYQESLNALGQQIADLPGYTRPEGGFFVWFDAGENQGDELARKIWKEQGMQVLPGSIMSQKDPITGKLPGANYIRLAAIYEPDKMSEVGRRLRTSVLG